MFGCLGKVALGLAMGSFVVLGGCGLIMGSCAMGLGGAVTRATNGMSSEEVVTLLDQGVERLGSLALASPSHIIGELDRTADGYAGSYEAQCQGLTQSCALFGGTDLDHRTITVRFALEEGPGSARLLLKRFGEDLTVACAGETGERTLNLDTGSNYLCLETVDYSGKIQVEVSEA